MSNLVSILIRWKEKSKILMHQILKCHYIYIYIYIYIYLCVGYDRTYFKINKIIKDLSYEMFKKTFMKTNK